MSEGGPRELLAGVYAALGGDAAATETVEFTDPGALPSVFAVSDLAAASIGAAGAAVAELCGARGAHVTVSERLASLWFGWSIRPVGWTLPAPWDPLARDYPARDGWIRLHTNAPHHRAAALRALGVPGDPQQVAQAVDGWEAEALERAVIEQGGCAAAMRSTDAWRQHPQGKVVTAEPLLACELTDAAAEALWPMTRARPLAGLRVLDLTRVLAGPVATRLLAGYGAEVLRIDPPGWDEPAVVPEVTLGKRCARLDLRDPTGMERFKQLLSRAHVLVHGYRTDALERLGLSAATRRALRPGLIDVALNAYGWEGPWRERRGFDSLVQMSTGIAEAGMRRLGRERPTPLPVQALDHATGYLMAAAVILGLKQRLDSGRGCEARLSLARTAELLLRGRPGAAELTPPSPRDEDYAEEIENSEFGVARRLRPPLTIEATPLHWERAASRLGSSAAEWAE